MMHALGQRETDAAVVELFHLGTAAGSGLDHLHFDYLETSFTAICVCFIITIEFKNVLSRQHSK